MRLRVSPELVNALGSLRRGPVRIGSFCLPRRVRGFEAGRHRGGRAGQVLVVVDTQESDPALLAEGEPDEAAELDEFRLREVPMQRRPERVVLQPRDAVTMLSGKPDPG